MFFRSGSCRERRKPSGSAVVFLGLFFAVGRDGFDGFGSSDVLQAGTEADAYC